MTKLEIEVDDKTAADIEMAETMFCAWVREKSEAKKEEILEKVSKVFEKNPKAFAVHRLRPPSIFLNKNDPSLTKMFS